MAKFTREMRKTHKIYIPDMLHYHNELLKAAFYYGGYELDIVPEYKNAEQLALKFISSDYCLPTVSIVGQIIAFLADRGSFERLAFMEPQAGGACRAGNIYNLIKEVLAKLGYGDIPVISLNMTGQERHPGFTINPKLISGCIAAVCYGDLLMTLTRQTEPYEKISGETQAVRFRWLGQLDSDIRHGRSLSRKKRKEVYRQIISDFNSIEKEDRKLKKVGVTGEIYMKFSPIGNRHLEDKLREYECEYRLGGFVNYAMYVVYTEMQNAKLELKNDVIIRAFEVVLKYLCRIQRELSESLVRYGFRADADFFKLKELADQILNDGYNIGDGWLIAGEVLDLISQGYDHVLILHPFGCLVSHVGGRGIIKKIKALHPEVNLQSIEYDYDQSAAMLESRILLALA